VKFARTNNGFSLNRRNHHSNAHTSQPLNLNFEDLNATNLGNKHNTRDT
jgi:hypothetical protein